MGNTIGYCSTTSLACQNYLDGLSLLQQVSCNNHAFQSVCNPTTSYDCEGNVDVCIEMLGSEGALCGQSNSNCGKPYHECNEGYECRFEGSSGCGDEYRCRTPTASPTPSPITPETPQPTTRPSYFSKSATTFISKFPSGQADLFSNNFVAITTPGENQIYHPKSSGEWLKVKTFHTNGTSKAAVMLNQVFSSDNSTYYDKEHILWIDSSSNIYYQTWDATSHPTASPTKFPTYFPTKSPTEQDLGFYFTIELFEVSGGVEYPMNRWVEIEELPKFFSGNKQFDIQPTYFDPYRKVTGFIEKNLKLTHVQLSYRVFDPYFLDFKDTFKIVLTVKKNQNSGFEAIYYVEQFTIVADQINCPPGSYKWNGQESEQFCVGNDLLSAGDYCQESGVNKYKSKSNYEPPEFKTYATCFYLNEEKEVEKIRNSIMGSSYTGTVIFPIEGSKNFLPYKKGLTADINLNPVILTITNWFLTSDEFVLGKIKAYDKEGYMIKNVQVSDIDVIQGLVDKSNTLKPFCKERRAVFDPACSVFGFGQGCCIIDDYENGSVGKCDGEVFDTVTTPLALIYDCRAECSRSAACIAFDMKTTTTTRTCNFYNKVKLAPLNVAGYTCYQSKAPVSVFQNSYPLASYRNSMKKSYFDCANGLELTGAGTCGNEAAFSFQDINNLVKLQIELPPDTENVIMEVGSSNVLETIDGQTGNKRSGFFFDFEQGGVPLYSGEFAPRTFWDSARRYVFLKTIDGEAVGDPELILPEAKSLDLYLLFCNDAIEDVWWNQSALIRNMVYVSGIDLIDECDRASSNYESGNMNDFVKRIGLLRLKLQQVHQEIGVKSTPAYFIDFEKYEPNIKTRREVFSLIVQFLNSIDKPVDCRLWEIPYDPNRVAMEMFYEFKFPTVYKALCDQEQDIQYSYKNVVYQRGMQNAPCVSNGQCKSGFVCAKWRCTNETNEAICLEGESLISPDYYQLLPAHVPYQACAYRNFYDNEGQYDAPDFYPNDENPTEVEFDALWKDNTCNGARNIPQRTSIDYFAKHGNQQECAAFGSSELYDFGFSYIKPMFGYVDDTCVRGTANELYNNYKGFYDRVLPHKPPALNSVTQNTFRGNINTSPAAMAFKNSETIESLIDTLDFKCSYQPKADFMSEISFVKEECENEEGCAWNEALGKCVASKEEIEPFICLFISEERQCLLSGFCKWVITEESFWGDQGRCEHKTDEAADTEEEIRAKYCPSISTVEMCAQFGCYFDPVFDACYLTANQILKTSDYSLLIDPHISDGSITGNAGVHGFRVRCAQMKKRVPGSAPGIIRYGKGPYHNEDDMNSRVLELCVNLVDFIYKPGYCEALGFVPEDTLTFKCDFQNTMQTRSVGQFDLNQYGSYDPYYWRCEPGAPICTGQETIDVTCIYNGGVPCRKYYEDTIYIHQASCSIYNTYARCKDVIGCSWIPLIKKCVFNDKDGLISFYDDLDTNIFSFPPRQKAADIQKYYNKTIDQNSDYNWNNFFTEWEPSPLIKQKVSNYFKPCDYNMIDECMNSEFCKWNFNDFKCEMNICAAFPKLYSSERLKASTAGVENSYGSDDAVYANARPCKRLKGCKEDLVTFQCVKEGTRTWAEKVSEDMAFCDRVFVETKECGYQLLEKDFVCVFLTEGSSCEARYPQLSSLSSENASAFLSHSIFERNSKSYLDSFYNVYRDAELNLLGDVVTLQFLAADEMYYLGLETTSNLTEVLGYNSTNYLFIPSVEFYSMEPGWPEIMTKSAIHVFEYIDLFDVPLLVRALREDESKNTMENDILSQMVQESVTRHRKIFMVASRTLANQYRDMEQLITLEAQFMAEEFYWLCNTEDRLTNILSILQDLIGEEAIISFSQDLFTYSYTDDYLGDTTEEQSTIFLKNVVHALMTSTSLNLFEKLKDPLNGITTSLRELSFLDDVNVGDDGGIDPLRTAHFFTRLKGFVPGLRRQLSIQGYFDEIAEIASGADYTDKRAKQAASELNMRASTGRTPAAHQQNAAVQNSFSGRQQPPPSRTNVKPVPSATAERIKPVKPTPTQTSVRATSTGGTYFDLSSFDPNAPAPPAGTPERVRWARAQANYKADLARNSRRKPVKPADPPKPPKPAPLANQRPNLIDSTRQKQNLKKLQKALGQAMENPKIAQAQKACDTLKEVVDQATQTRPTTIIEETPKLPDIPTKTFNSIATQTSTILGVPLPVKKPSKISTAVTEAATFAGKIGKGITKGVGKVLNAVGKVLRALAPGLAVLDIYELVKSFEEYEKASENPAFCKYVEELTNGDLAVWSIQITQSVSGIIELGGFVFPPAMLAAKAVEIGGLALAFLSAAVFNPSEIRSGRLWKQFRVALLGDYDLLSPQYQCSQRISYSMYDAKGSTGVVDHRADVNTCNKNFVSTLRLDNHFSNPLTGLNTFCSSSSECKRDSQVGTCVFGRCVFPVQYLASKSCIQPLRARTALLTDVESLKYNVVASTNSMREGIPQKRVRYDPLKDGITFIQACNYSNYAMITWNYNTGEVSENILCFE